jgi:hypothetical protein
MIKASAKEKARKWTASKLMPRKPARKKAKREAIKEFHREAKRICRKRGMDYGLDGLDVCLLVRFKHDAVESAKDLVELIGAVRKATCKWRVR